MNCIFIKYSALDVSAYLNLVFGEYTEKPPDGSVVFHGEDHYFDFYRASHPSLNALGKSVTLPYPPKVNQQHMHWGWIFMSVVVSDNAEESLPALIYIGDVTISMNLLTFLCFRGFVEGYGGGCRIVVCLREGYCFNFPLSLCP